MHHVIGALVIGGVAGGVTGGRAFLRPMVREIVKGGIVAKRKIQSVGYAAIAETRRLVDEARADLDRPETEPRT
jgi:hypothetical protein